MDKNPWKTLGSKVIYQNPWITLREDKVVQPGGKEGIYSVVEPRGLAVGVLALDDDACVVLVGQYRYPLQRYSWEIIEGGGEGEETALETAQRELQEEAGLQAEDWKPLGDRFHLSNCFTSEEGRLFLAQGLSSIAATPDPTEQLVIKRVPLDECVTMVLSGEITDSLSVIAVLMIARERGL